MSDDYTSTGIAEPPGETKTPATTSTAVKAERTGRNGSGTAVPEPETRVQVGPPKTVWREYFESAVVTVIMALFGMTFVVQAVKVPTGSMQNTINIGDHLLVNKFIFAAGPPLPFLPQREIKRGDIVVFKYPGNKYKPYKDLEHENNTPYKTNYVKRVIGLPGDRVEIRGTHVIINGQPLPERRVQAEEKNNLAPLTIVNDSARPSDGPYTVYYNSLNDADYRNSNSSYDTFNEEGNGKEVTVPQDSYFVMGDNRDNSEDSRYWGFVKRDLVMGRAMFVYWSFDESAKPSDTTPGKIMDFFTHSRWNRTGTMVK
ncbi:MAG: signal peptidase [Blastocatellia bacterium]|jgi:signal peptidase I|nr:signal peptidase [Blastocatellia bacterium]